MKKANLTLKNYRAEEISLKFNIRDINKEENQIRKDNLKVEIGVGQDEKQFAVKMTYDERNIDNCCDLKVVLIGQFEIDEEAKEKINDYVPNAVAILFPYLRSTISTITSAAGMPPLILPVMNFSIE